jgi:PGF-CTERM protein
MPMGNISVITTPVNGTISIDGNPVGRSPYCGEHIVGTYIVSFEDIEGYYTPEEHKTVTVKANETTPVEGVYVKKQKYSIKIIADREGADIYIEGFGWRKYSFEEEFYENTNLSVTFGKVIEGLICYAPYNENIKITVKSNQTITMHYKKAPTATLEITTVSVTEGRKKIEGEIYVDNKPVGRGSCSVECWIGCTPVISFGPSPEFYDMGKPKYELCTKYIQVDDLGENELRRVEGEYKRAKYSPKAEILSPKGRATVYSDEFIELSGRGFDPDGCISEYLWSVNGLIIGHGKDLRYKFKDMGRHTVTLAVIDDDGLSGEASVEVNVDIKPVIELSLDPPVILVPGEDSKLTITIKTFLRQPITIVGIQEISCSDGTIIKGGYREDILTDVRVSGGSPVIKTVYVSATLPGTYSIKLKGYYWLKDEPNNRMQIESKEVDLKAERRGPKPTPTPAPPGFEVIVAIIVLLAVAYLLGRKK